jgi:hypothetical protein
VRQTTQTLREQAQSAMQEALVPLGKGVQNLRLHFQEEITKARQFFEQEAQKAAEAYSQKIAERTELAAEQDFAGVLQVFRARLAGQAEAQIDPTIQTVLESFRGRLRGLTHEEVLSFQRAAQEEIRSISNALLAATSQALREEGHKISIAVQNDLKAYQTIAFDDARKQLLAMRQPTLESIVQDANASLEHFRSELENSSENLLHSSDAQMRKQTEQALALFTNLLKEKEEEVINDATTVFRNSLAGAFSMLQGGAKKTP